MAALWLFFRLLGIYFDMKQFLKRSLMKIGGKHSVTCKLDTSFHMSSAMLSLTVGNPKLFFYLCIWFYMYRPKIREKKSNVGTGERIFFSRSTLNSSVLSRLSGFASCCPVREVYHIWWLLSSSTLVIHPISLRHIPQYSWGWDAQGVYGIFWWVEEKEVLGLVHRQGMIDNVTSGTHLHFGRLAAGWELGSRSSSLCSQNCIFSCHV